MITPMPGKVIAKRAVQATQTKGGLYLPQSKEEKMFEAVILHVGRGVRLADGTIDEMVVQPGDRIVFPQYSENDVIIDGEAFVVIKQDDIAAVVGNVNVKDY